MGFFLTKQVNDLAVEITPARRTGLGSKKGLGAPFCGAILSAKYWDADTKTYAYQLRDYNPGTGRWLSRDPIGENGGQNLYCMLDNSPVSDVDVWGERGYQRPLPRPTPPRTPRLRPQPPRNPGDPTPVTNPAAPPENWGQAIFNICIQFLIPDALSDQQRLNEVLGELQKASNRIPCGQNRCVIVIIDGVIDDPVDRDIGVILPPSREAYYFNVSGKMGADPNKNCCEGSERTSSGDCCREKKEKKIPCSCK